MTCTSTPSITTCETLTSPVMKGRGVYGNLYARALVISDGKHDLEKPTPEDQQALVEGQDPMPFLAEQEGLVFRTTSAFGRDDTIVVGGGLLRDYLGGLESVGTDRAEGRRRRRRRCAVRHPPLDALLQR